MVHTEKQLIVGVNDFLFSEVKMNTLIVRRDGYYMAVSTIIQYKGSPNVFAWKFPDDHIGTWTQLIVHESQEAVLFKGGQALDVFQAGRHTLETKNIPLLSKLINLPFGGKSPFTAEVWYINKVHSLEIKWGTPTPIQIQDPKYEIFVPVRAFGQFAIQIKDAKQFLIKLVGTVPQFDKKQLTDYFRGLYLTKAKDGISSYIIKKRISVVEINAYSSEISESLRSTMAPIFAEYGIHLVNFFVNDINTPEDDPAVVSLKKSLAKRAEMNIIGYSYSQERSFDTLEGAAKNTSGGQAGLMGAGIGLGLGVGVGGAMGNQMGALANNLQTNQTKQCPSCNNSMDAQTRYCPDCGKDTTAKQEESIGQVTCSDCGNTFSEKMKFCPECGSPYNACIFCAADIPTGSAICPICGKKQPRPCPKCGSLVENPLAKFCPECGNSLVRSCSQCGVKIEGSPKFCPECGNKLDKGEL